MKRYQIKEVYTASDLRQHTWLQDGKSDIKKKKSQLTLHNDGKVQVVLSLKELLNVSSDWMDVKSKGLGTASMDRGGMPSDFQQGQVERIIDALALALPTSAGLGSKSGGQMHAFTDSDIKELSYDLGVDARILKYRLQ